MMARLPELQILANQAAVFQSAGLQVVFSPWVQKALLSGTATLMQSSARTLPVAVNHSGQIMGIAHVAGGTGAAAGAGAAAVVAWPVILASAVAVAAAMAQQWWLENTLGRLEEALARILRTVCATLTVPRPRYPDGFATVRTEGAILPRDVLARLAAGQKDLRLLRPKYLTTPGVRG